MRTSCDFIFLITTEKLCGIHLVYRALCAVYRPCCSSMTSCPEWAWCAGIKSRALWNYMRFKSFNLVNKTQYFVILTCIHIILSWSPVFCSHSNSKCDSTTNSYPESDNFSLLPLFIAARLIYENGSQIPITLLLRNCPWLPFHSEEKPRSSRQPLRPTLPTSVTLPPMSSGHYLSSCCSHTVTSLLVLAQKNLWTTAPSARSAVLPDTHRVCPLTLQGHSNPCFFLSHPLENCHPCSPPMLHLSIFAASFYFLSPYPTPYSLYWPISGIICLLL